MDINDQKTISFGGSPKVGAEFFSLGYHSPAEAVPPPPEPVRNELFYLMCINETLMEIYHHLTRPRWYDRLWAWLKGVFHVA